MGEAKTRAEIEQLKAQWRADPCWDIEETEGFEAHRWELLSCRLQCELDAARRTEQEARQLGLTTFGYARLRQLEDRVRRIENAHALETADR